MRGEQVVGRIRSRLSYANVMATFAVFLALAGTAAAKIIVTGRDVRDGSLTGADVKNGSLTAAEFARLGPAPVKANPDPLMAQMDGNKDGKVTKAEHAAAGSARFTQMDGNKDGTLTEAEARAAMK